MHLTNLQIVLILFAVSNVASYFAGMRRGARK